MSLASKILLGFIFVASLGFLYCAARTLRTHEAWREKAEEFQTDITQTEESIQTNRFGKRSPAGKVEVPSMRDLETELHDLVNEPGRIWRDCTHTAIGADGSVSVTVGSPPVHNITGGTHLFVFESQSASEGGKYVGEFRVAEEPAAPDAQIRLVPAITPRGGEVPTTNSEFWQLRDVMPKDSHQIFAEKTDAEIRAMLRDEADATEDQFVHDGASSEDAPEDLVPEQVQVRVRFLKPYTLQLPERDAEGQITGQRSRPFAPGDEFWFAAEPSGDPDAPGASAEELISEGIAEEVERRYVRPLRNYQALFVEHGRNRVVLEEIQEGINNDIEYTNNAVALATKQIADAEDLQGRLEAEKKSLEGEAEAAAEFRDEMQARLDYTRKKVQELLDANRELIAKLKAQQEKLVRQATRATADANTGLGQ